MMESSYFQNHWAIYIVLVAFLLAGYEAWLRRRFALCVGIRFLWIALLGLVVAELTMVSATRWSQPEAIKVFFDRSDSVALLGERKARSETLLKEIHSWAEEKKLPLQIYSFGDNLLEENLSIQWGAFKSLLSPAVEKIQQHEGVAVVVSDGLWTDRVKFKSPTFGISLSDRADDSEKDIWIEKLQPIFTAFLKNRLKIPASLGQKGFTGKKVRVSLWRSNEKLSSQEIQLDSGETNIEFNYFPDRMGEQTFILKIEPLDGELSALNNELPVKNRTVRDKIRILHVGGKPSLDLKAWRLFLTRQPDVDLVSFYILRSQSDDPEAKNSELSLIPFPYEELFSTELEKFDVVILQNFDFNLYFPPFYLANLARFVREGGALLMIGGDQSFHRYEGSPLEPIFPFRFNRGGAFEEDISAIEFGAKHPLMTGLESAFQVPKWSARHRVIESPESSTLIKFSKAGAPFISIREVDKGRVAAINSDESWKLQMQPTKEPPIFGKFARRLVQYLTFDPEVNPQGMISSAWQVGKEVSVELATHEKTNWHIRSLAFKNFEASFNNEAVMKFRVPFAGVFEVTADAVKEPRVFETEEQPWRSEWRNLISDSSKLKELAEPTGGKFFSFDEREKIFNQPLSGKQMVSAQVASWTRGSAGLSWLVLLLAIGLMCFDFFLRKRLHWDA